MDEVAKSLKEEILDGAADQAQKLIYEIGSQIAQQQGLKTEMEAARQAKKEIDKFQETILNTIQDDRRANEKKFHEVQSKQIPEAVANLKMLAQQDNSQLVGQMGNVKEQMVDEINRYKFRIDVFEQSVSTVLTKFKRLQGDWLIRSVNFDQ